MCFPLFRLGCVLLRINHLCIISNTREINWFRDVQTTSFSKIILLQREPFITMFYTYQPLPISRYQVGFLLIQPGSYFMRMRSEFDVTTILSQRYSQVSCPEPNCCEYAIFVTSTFASHSHSQEVWTGLT